MTLPRVTAMNRRGHSAVAPRATPSRLLDASRRHRPAPAARPRPDDPPRADRPVAGVDPPAFRRRADRRPLGRGARSRAAQGTHAVPPAPHGAPRPPPPAD